MPWLLDTNICIYITKQKPPAVFEKFKTIESDPLFLSAITIAELEYGVRKSTSFEKNSSALRQFISPFNIVPFDYEASLAYGIIRASLEQKGQSIGPLDTLIAAHAKSRNYILVTNNTREFKKVEGLQMENWTVA